MKTFIDPNLAILEVTEYPEDYMDVVYHPGTEEVRQLVYICPYGYFTRLGKQWRAFLPDDSTLENLDSVHVRNDDRMKVRDMFDEAQMSGKVLQYKELEKHVVYYSFELEEDSQ